jgi:HPt (histidine-containing phosphotransfer) domain-containing protein
MAYDPGALHAALAAAAGGDAALAAELRAVFVTSAEGLADLLRRSRCDANWRAAAWRLHGLGASFGAIELAALAQEAANGVPGDPLALRRIEAAIAALAA